MVPERTVVDLAADSVASVANRRTNVCPNNEGKERGACFCGRSNIIQVLAALFLRNNCIIARIPQEPAEECVLMFVKVSKGKYFLVPSVAL